ncbi:MAG: hypothetical protein U5N56_03250 [Candidatus Marinimicrobia bacterium]|nr:hypothetical protein [Candidatus Neomarinimicrobiota bacterium]
MNEFLKKEVQRVFNEKEQEQITKEDIKKWVRKTRLKQIVFIFFESVILLGFGLGNIMNNPVRSFSFALGILCLVVWPFLAVNIHRYLKKIDYEEDDLDEIIKALKKEMLAR